MTYETTYLAHHGIKGQRWGVRRFQNTDGTLTSAGKQRYDSGDTRKSSDNSTNSQRKGLTDKQKKSYKIGVAATATALAVYGGYKYSQHINANASAISAGMQYTKSNSVSSTSSGVMGSVLKDVNPNYHLGTQFQMNCGNTVLAAEARCRGMDVEAMPNATGLTISSMGQYINGLKSESFLQMGRTIQRQKDGEDLVTAGLRIQGEITKALSDKYPEGSRGCMMVPSKQGLHWVSWEISNGTAAIHNPQAPKMPLTTFFGDLTYYRNDMNSELTAIRLDDVDFNRSTIDRVITKRGTGLTKRQQHQSFIETNGSFVMDRRRRS